MTLFAAIRASWPRLLRRLRLAVVGAGLAGGFQPCPAAEVLVLNSDENVEKYGVVQRAFVDTLDAALGALPVSVTGASGEEARVRRLIREQDPKYILCIGSKAYLAAQGSTGSRNVILAGALNWKRLPLGSKTYAIANELPAEMELTLFRYFFPKLQTVAVLYDPKFNKEWFAAAEDAARKMGLKLVEREVSSAGDVRRALAQVLSRSQAFWLIPDPTVLTSEQAIRDIVGQARAARKPVLTYNPAFADLGAALAVSPDVPTVGRQAAWLVSELVGRRKVEDKVQSPAGSEVILNLRAVGECDLDLNEEALGSVNRIIR